MKVYVLEAEHEEVPGKDMKVFSTLESAQTYEAELRVRFGDELEYTDITEMEVEA
jgi:hypothetical protein